MRWPPDPPPELRYSGEPPDRTIAWVRPELVAEVQFVGWSGSGRIRHATYLGLREDKPAGDIVRPAADPEAARVTYTSAPSRQRREGGSTPARAPVRRKTAAPAGDAPPPSPPRAARPRARR